jgi:hypothetical protein
MGLAVIPTDALRCDIAILPHMLADIVSTGDMNDSTAIM